MQRLYLEKIYPRENIKNHSTKFFIISTYQTSKFTSENAIALGKRLGRIGVQEFAATWPFLLSHAPGKKSKKNRPALKNCADLS